LHFNWALDLEKPRVCNSAIKRNILFVLDK